MNSILRAALVQQSPVFLNLKESLSLAIDFINEAADYGAEIIAFPETWLPGYPVWLDRSPGAAIWGSKPAAKIFRLLYENSAELPGGLVELSATSAKRKINVVIGVNEKQKGTIYNTIAYIDINGEISIHRKLVPTYSERLVWGRGDGSTLNYLKTAKGVIGALVCWEHWMPAARAYMHSLNEILHVAQWPDVHEVHTIASRHYAFEGRCFVLASGVYMTNGDIIEGYRSTGDRSEAFEMLAPFAENPGKPYLKGSSCFIAPDARILSGPFEKAGGIYYEDLNLDEIAEAKITLDTDGHYSRPDVFSISVNFEKQENIKTSKGSLQ